MRQTNTTKLPEYIESDESLKKYEGIVHNRDARVAELRRLVKGSKKTLSAASNWHKNYGLHLTPKGWTFAEWLPNATNAWLIGDFSKWKRTKAFQLSSNGIGNWTGRFPVDSISHGQQYRLSIDWPGGSGERIPTAVTCVTRNTTDITAANVIFNAQVWQPPKKFVWRHKRPGKSNLPLIYEAHVGMSQERHCISTFAEFQKSILPRIAKDGYNTIQMMAVMQHPYYASFGYHVTNLFAINDLFGTPDDFKRLIDAAHNLGIRVIIDLVHSHTAPNTVEGLSEMDGTPYIYCHGNDRGLHKAWGSRCFDYGKPQLLALLLSNCKFWLDEYHLDGFRFDGVTSMLYRDHGLNRGFWSNDDYFSENVDWDAFAYLALANELIKEVNPDAITIAEEVSDIPGITSPVEGSGLGFDYRLAMGVTDYWFKLTDIRDEDWNMGKLWYELTSRRSNEHAISYVESHDQALVGGQSFFFKLAGAEVFNNMSLNATSLVIDRAMALHKMARLATFATAADGYLNFMGNEFGHPEWIDFPTAQNNWSFQYARRQWSLADDANLKYHFLGDFDQAMLDLLFISPNLHLHPCQFIMADESRKLLLFFRNNMLFAFNFHPTRSYNDLEFLCFPGSYRLALDTDSKQFGGFDRVRPNQRYFSTSKRKGNRIDEFLSIYLPCRSAIVLLLESNKRSAAQRIIPT